jgi:hypothetical protein
LLWLQGCCFTDLCMHCLLWLQRCLHSSVVQCSLLLVYTVCLIVCCVHCKLYAHRQTVEQHPTENNQQLQQQQQPQHNTFTHFYCAQKLLLEGLLFPSPVPQPAIIGPSILPWSFKLSTKPIFEWPHVLRQEVQLRARCPRV